MRLRLAPVFVVAALAGHCARPSDGFSVACTRTPVGASFAAVDARLAAFGAKPYEIMDGFAWRRSNLFGSETDACDVEFDVKGASVRAAFFPAAR